MDPFVSLNYLFHAHFDTKIEINKRLWLIKIVTELFIILNHHRQSSLLLIEHYTYIRVDTDRGFPFLYTVRQSNDLKFYDDDHTYISSILILYGRWMVSLLSKITPIFLYVSYLRDQSSTQHRSSTGTNFMFTYNWRAVQSSSRGRWI